MKNFFIISFIFFLAAAGLPLLVNRNLNRRSAQSPSPERLEGQINNQDQNSKVEEQSGENSPASDIQKDIKNSMTISSPLFNHNGGLPINATCDGKGVNPPLEISGVPKDAKSLAIIVKDPDAPRGTFIHWVLWNIDPSTKIIKENSVPDGAIQGATSAQRLGYVGACPPSGTHRYFFYLYALDEALDLPSSTTALELEHDIDGHVLEDTHITGLYR
jgi:Raf kinase inhibitor-like YbhB/YbcL family protein